MRGRTKSRLLTDSEESTGSQNPSELSAALSNSQKPPKRQPLLRTTSLYTVSESTHEEPALPSSNMNHHASKLMANRQRSSAASVLFHNLKNKRNSGAFSVRDQRAGSYAAADSRGAAPGGAPLNVHIYASQNDKGSRSCSERNPISHYQFARNLTTRPKSSSTTHIPTLASIRQADAAPSSLSLSLELRSKKSSTGPATDALAGSGAQARNRSLAEERSELPHKDSIADDASGQDEDAKARFLESEIEIAINEELFPREYAFDNKFDDIIETPKTSELNDAPSIGSSNQSPLTKVPARRLSKAESLALEGFQKDLLNRSASNSSTGSHTSRLQMKMEVLKKRFDSFASGEDLSGCSDSSVFTSKGDSNWPANNRFRLFPAADAQPHAQVVDDDDDDTHGAPASRFWLRNDLQTKLLTERLSNQLKTIERFPSSGVVGEKILVSTVKSICKEQDISTKALERQKLSRSQTRPMVRDPLLQLNTAEKDAEFERLFNSAKQLPAPSDPRAPSFGTQTEADQLRGSIRLGRSLFEDFWRESERAEARALAVAAIE
ncbi:LAQU0S12e01486g1_1 [Lachancea quebecensis]|uniref:LAQU0S12e01486g1_1 n=1 Tax=Lachancea quebecensis TaxID=1654605 RepID=A0A0P1KUL5_9SACH|nr:LAQU0S12e01486g1_1 [Lachancea quebecensis]